MLIDSHCHLDDEKYVVLDEVIERAADNNVCGILSVAADILEWDKVVSIADTYNNVWAALGIHPYGCCDYQKIKKSAFESKKVVAVGECGLDYAGDNADDKKGQKKAFIFQLDLARELDLPVIIHTRDADKDMGDILSSEYKNKPFRAVLHSYTSGWDLLKIGLDLDFFVSASGIITFKNAPEVRANFEKAPVDKILVETDGPWLAPVPFRGKICEPFMVKYTAEKLAELKDMKFEDIEDITTDNFFRLFNKCL